MRVNEPGNSKPPTLGDLAKAAGVSKGTASNVFNRPGIVSEEVRQRVQEAARALRYRGPDPKGRMLSAGKVNAIGVATMWNLSYFFDDPFARQLMIGIAEACEAEGIGLSLVSAAGEPDLAWNMRSALVDGFILFCLTDAQRLIAHARERQLPVVALDLGEVGAELSGIGIDNVTASRELAERLCELGHRRFAVLAMELVTGGFGRVRLEMIGEASDSPRDRLRGTVEALAAHGIVPEDVPIYETMSDEPSVHAALAELFALHRPPTAIVAQSDRIALIALAWLRERGLSVPGDVSLVGFDGIPEAGASQPPLTTMRQPIAEIGRRAVRKLIDRPQEIARETLATEFVPGGTIAPPRS